MNEMNTPRHNLNEADRRDGWTPDERLESLLDEVLDAGSVSGGVPDSLTQAILARTAAKLPVAAGSGGSRGSNDDGGQASPVLARIGVRGWSALAACVALAAGAGVWMSNIPGNNTQPVPSISPTEHAVVLSSDEAVLQREIAAVVEYEEFTETIDRELTLLAMHLDQPEDNSQSREWEDEFFGYPTDPMGGMAF
jgi:hypothetical protein